MVKIEIEKRKFGYCRVSKEEQIIENQIIELKKYGVKPSDIYIDEGVSGTVAPLKRKGFKVVYDAIQAGLVSELYVFEMRFCHFPLNFFFFSNNM